MKESNKIHVYVLIHLLKRIDRMPHNLLKILLVFFSVISGFFLPKRSIVRYLPVTIFSTATILLEILDFTIHKLWNVKGGRKGIFSTALSLVIGPYFFSNLWVFHLSKGKFLRYTLLNIIGDLLYAFPGIKLFRKWNFFKLIISSLQFFILLITNAYLNY